MSSAYFVGKDGSPEAHEYYRRCRERNEPAITIEPRRGGYCMVFLDYFPTSDSRGAFREMSEEQEQEMIKIIDKYEKFMPKTGWITYGRHHLKAKVKKGAAELMAMELREIMG